MALVKKLSKLTMDRNIIHDPVDCSYTVFIDESHGKILQIDTYGSKTRKLKGKKSQSIQFNQDSLQQLSDIIKSIL